MKKIAWTVLAMRDNGFSRVHGTCSCGVWEGQSETAVIRRFHFRFLDFLLQLLLHVKKKKTQRSIFNMLNHIGNFDITTDGFLEFKTTHRLILQEGSLVCFPYSWRRYFFRMVRSLQPTAATLLYPKFWRHLWDPIYMILVSSRTVSVKQEREATI